VACPEAEASAFATASARRAGGASAYAFGFGETRQRCAKRLARHGAKSVTAPCLIRFVPARLFAPVSCKICDAPWGNRVSAAQILLEK
jgi:hypothetical protein